MGKNPYTIMFGKEPQQVIPRPIQRDEITEIFAEENPTQQIFLITGIRGMGKTVFMTEVSEKIAKDKDWIVVELNPEKDMLVDLAAKLASENSLAGIFKEAKINLSFFGIGLEVTGSVPITSIDLALEKMLESLKKKGRKVLITVDEAVSNKEMRIFTNTFQILVRKNLPVFLLMTGLYENIYELQNEKTLTFLYRAPKIDLGPLNISAVADNYEKVFDVERDKALSMARLTKGYSFAFQVLGHFAWENGLEEEKWMSSFRQYLFEYSYDKIWSELSRGDKKFLYAMSQSPEGKISDIKEFLQTDNNSINPYRSRLIKRGLINGEERGYVTFVLPQFDRYVAETY